MSYSILRLDQIEGDNRLGIFDKVGADAEVTGFANYRGARSFPLIGKYFASQNLPVESPVLNKKCAKYWTSTKDPDSPLKCYAYGKAHTQTVTPRSDDVGVRVCVPIDEIKDQITDIETVDYGKGEVKVAKFGEYPKDLLSWEESRELNKLYESGEMKPTGKSYTVSGYRIELYYDGQEKHYEQDECEEYTINGKKYAKVQPAVYEDDIFGRSYRWVEVKPIEWYLDEESGLAVSKDIIIGGMPMTRAPLYFGNFDNTIISDFLNEEFAIDSRIVENKKEMIDEMLEDPQEEIFPKQRTL